MLSLYLTRNKFWNCLVYFQMCYDNIFYQAMAMNTRQEYLRDLAVNHTLQTGLDGGQRFTTKFSLTAASRRVIDRDKSKNKLSPEEFSQGSLIWNVVMQDCT